jgi:hypothetical protein
MGTPMKRWMAGSMVLLMAPALTAARVKIAPAQGGSPTAAEDDRPSPATPSHNRVIRQGTNVESQPAPRQTAPTRPTTGRGIDGKGDDRTQAPVRVRPVGGGSWDTSTSRQTLGAGRTRIVRESKTPAPERHGAIATNTTIVRDIENHQRTEVVPDRNYWHNVHGTRYCHTYRSGFHWYGFYFGPHFYWTRYYGGRWWWYDRGFGHWVYWGNGYWWWPGPGGATYVFVDNAYYPREEAPVDVEPPAAEEPPSAPEEAGGEWTSPDGKRAVQIHGPQSEAFLYDQSGKEPVYMGYLGKNVEKVRFSGGKDGKPVRILIDFRNGDFALFSADGEPLDLQPPPVPEESPKG